MYWCTTPGGSATDPPPDGDTQPSRGTPRSTCSAPRSAHSSSSSPTPPPPPPRSAPTSTLRWVGALATCSLLPHLGGGAHRSPSPGWGGRWRTRCRCRWRVEAQGWGRGEVGPMLEASGPLGAFLGLNTFHPAVLDCSLHPLTVLLEGVEWVGAGQCPQWDEGRVHPPSPHPRCPW